MEKLAHFPRVLILVSGGVAEYTADSGVEVALVDFDAAATDDNYKITLAPYWRSLVDPTDAALFVEYEGKE